MVNNILLSEQNLWVYFYSQAPFDGDVLLRGSKVAVNESCESAIFQQSGCNLGAPSENDWGLIPSVYNSLICTGGTWYTNENTVYYEVLADSTQASIEVKNIDCDDGVTGIAQLGVWKHDCSYIGDTLSYTNGNFLACDVSNSANVTFNTVPGEEYYLVIDGNAGSICKWEIEYDHVYACETPLVFNVSKMFNCVSDSFEIEVIGAKATGDDWYLYTDSCGGSLVASSNDSMFVLPNINQSYYVRGEHIDTNCTILGPCFSFSTTASSGDTTIVTNTYEGCDSIYYYDRFISNDTIIIESIAGNGCLSLSIDTIIIYNSVETQLPSVTSCDSAYIFDLWRHTSGTYSKVLQTSNGCDSTVSIYFDKIDSTNLNVLRGTVLYIGTPISSGRVQLIHKPLNSPNSMVVIDEVSVNADGSYEFSGVDSELSTYMIIAEGDTGLYPDAVPTYYDTTNHWQKAKQINLMSCNDTVVDLDIYLIDFPAIIGHGSMNGRVSNSGDKSGVDVSNVSIFATNKTTDEVFHTKTDDSGLFQIDVTDGDYLVSAEILGYMIDSTHQITIDQDVQNVELEICLDSVDNEIVVCEIRIINSLELLNESNISIHPNPVKDVLIISTNTENVISNEMIRITDVAGREVQFDSKSNGKDLIINISEHEKGVYFIDIENRIHQKIIKE